MKLNPEEVVVVEAAGAVEEVARLEPP